MSDELVIDEPTYAISVQDDTTGRPWMGLNVQTSSVSITVYLANSSNYREAARKIHDGIIEAGKAMNKPRIVLAKGALPGQANGHITKGRG